MILKTLQLQNFRKYKQISMDFPEGIIGVIGLNGTGKSTIFEAIAWALYGTVAARTSSEDIRRDNAEPSSTCLADLQFHFEGDDYRVVRQMKGKNQISSATITRNGKLAATGAGPTTAYIQKILGIDYKSFFTSIFAKQKELNTLSSMNASERRPLILKMLGIDALDEVIKQINSEKRTKASVVALLEKNIYDGKGVEKEIILIDQEQECKKIIQKTKKEHTDIKKNIKQIKQDYQIQLHKTKEAKKNYESINKKFEELIKQKTIFENHQQIIQEVKNLENKIKKRKETIHILHKKFNQFKDIQEEIATINKRKNTLIKNSTSLLKKLTQQQTSLNLLIEQKKELISRQESIKKLGSDASCPTCERELGEQYKFLLEKYQEKHKIYQNKEKTTTKTINLLTSDIEQIDREITALNKKKDYFFQKQKEQETISIKLESQRQEIAVQEQELIKRHNIIKKLTSIDFDIDKFKEIQTKRKENYQKYQEHIKQVNTTKDILTKKQINMEKIQSKLSLEKQQLNIIKREQTDIKTMKDNIQKEKQKIQEISLLKEIMTDFRLHLISRIRPILSSHASRFFHDLTDGKYTEIMLDEQYNIFIYDNGEEYPIERFSGGEIDLANLCLRLAISDVITERAEGLFHFIILDEIFGSQDQLRQQNIMQELYKLSSTFKQIFLITHVEQVKHYMQHVINVEEIDNESKVSIQ